jgi:hypothetical protein
MAKPILLLALVAGLAVACGSPSQPVSPSRPPDPTETPPQTNDPGQVIDTDPVPPAPPPETPGEEPASTGENKPDGAACLEGSECASGVCEGEGCGGETPGTCMPRARGCTRDLRAYCGCDGQTFRGSGSCPMRRFAHRGECKTP